MEADSTTPFGKWRTFFWPIHRWELKKFVPMLAMFFLIAFNYNILRSYKDTIVVTASHSGAEALPFIKVWAVLPAAIIMTFIFTRLAYRYDREKVFYIFMALFLGFFFCFTFFLYPAHDYLHPHKFADYLQTILPAGFKGLIAIFRNWTFTLFYVMAELWSTTIFTVLFWGFANEVTGVHEAKRYYGILGTGGNIAGIFSGQAAILFSGNLTLPWLPYGKTAWDQSIFLLTIALLISGFFTILIFRWLNVNVIRPTERDIPQHLKPQKIKMSVRQNFLYIARSKYLICIAVIVVTYNLAMNLVEIVWKNKMKEFLPNPADYNGYMGKVMIVMAIIATVTGLITTSNVIRRFSWTTCAMISPVIIGATGLLFFAVVLLQEWNIPWFATLLGVSPLMLSVTLGSLQNCLSRASKYTVFDATKEISFIPLSNQSKLKGKAAIDGIGSRLGKSGGSLVHQGLLIVFATIGASSPYVAAIFLGVIVCWGLAVTALGKQFDQLVAEDVTIDVPDTEKLKPTLAESQS